MTGGGSTAAWPFVVTPRDGSALSHPLEPGGGGDGLGDHTRVEGGGDDVVGTAFDRGPTHLRGGALATCGGQGSTVSGPGSRWWVGAAQP